jgi:hypothetical protein
MQEKELLKVFDLLQIKEITTDRQKKNGTRVFKLPMKAYWKYADYSEPVILATYKSGYVRRLLTNSGVYGGPNGYQLNKRYEGEPEYFKDYEWQTKGVGDNCKQVQVWTGKYRAFTTRKCKLIPNEVDRLQYLLDYAIKNWYCKPQVQTKVKEVKVLQNIDVTIDGHKYKLQENDEV